MTLILSCLVELAEYNQKVSQHKEPSVKLTSDTFTAPT